MLIPINHYCFRIHMNTVSVVIPCYNSSETIQRALRSVLAQTYNINEIIVVDDGSTDDSVSKIEALKKNAKDKRIKVVLQENKGPSAARNKGIELANTDLIAFLDADDYWDNDKIQKQIELFSKRDNCILVACLNQPVNKKDKREKIISINQLLFKNYFGTSTVVVRSDVIKKNTFNENQKYSEDYDLWLRLSARGDCFLLMDQLCHQDDKPLYGSSGLSAKLWEMEKGELSNYFRVFKSRKKSLFLLIIVIVWSICKFMFRFMRTLLDKCHL